MPVTYEWQLPTRFRVTSQRMREGESGSCSRCPVANAIHECMPDKTYVSVGALVVHIAIQDVEAPATFYKYQASLPERVSDFIERYDQSAGMAPRPAEEVLATMEPFAFELEWAVRTE